MKEAEWAEGAPSPAEQKEMTVAGTAGRAPSQLPSSASSSLSINCHFINGKNANSAMCKLPSAKKQKKSVFSQTVCPASPQGCSHSQWVFSHGKAEQKYIWGFYSEFTPEFTHSARN